MKKVKSILHKLIFTFSLLFSLFVLFKIGIIQSDCANPAYDPSADDGGTANVSTGTGGVTVNCSGIKEIFQSNERYCCQQARNGLSLDAGLTHFYLNTYYDCCENFADIPSNCDVCSEGSVLHCTNCVLN